MSLNGNFKINDIYYEVVYLIFHFKKILWLQHTNLISDFKINRKSFGLNITKIEIKTEHNYLNDIYKLGIVLRKILQKRKRN